MDTLELLRKQLKQEDLDIDDSMTDVKLEPIETVDIPENEEDFEMGDNNVKMETLEMFNVDVEIEHNIVTVNAECSEDIKQVMQNDIQDFDMPSSNAEICKRNRGRKKNEALQMKATSKTSAERSGKYRLQQKQLGQRSKRTNEILYTASSRNSQMTFEPTAKSTRVAPVNKKPKQILRIEYPISNTSKLEIEINAVGKIPIMDKHLIEYEIVNIFNRIRKQTVTKSDCYICKKSFTKSNLNAHIRTHAKPYKCDVCKRNFSQKHSLDLHIRTHTGEKPFQCDICQKSFSRKSVFTNHVRIHSGDNTYKCGSCHRSFSLKSSLIQHLRVHIQKQQFKCDMCKKIYTCRNHLYMHMRTHTGEKPYKCDVCNKCFSYKNVLSDHSRIHTGEKPYKCDVCSKCFRYKNVLKEHIRTHTGEKPFKCVLCDKYFRQKSSLLIHSRVHANKKSFKCHLCDKGFNYKRVLDNHIQTIHEGNTNNSPVIMSENTGYKYK